MSTINHSDIPQTNTASYSAYLLEKIYSKDAHIEHLRTELSHAKQDRDAGWALAIGLVVIVVALFAKWPGGIL